MLTIQFSDNVRIMMYMYIIEGSNILDIKPPHLVYLIMHKCKFVSTLHRPIQINSLQFCTDVIVLVGFV